jgi:hypothetical protein
LIKPLGKASPAHTRQQEEARRQFAESVEGAKKRVKRAASTINKFLTAFFRGCVIIMAIILTFLCVGVACGLLLDRTTDVAERVSGSFLALLGAVFFWCLSFACAQRKKK